MLPSLTCSILQAEDEDGRRIHEMNKKHATEERALLSNLYYNRQRPDLQDNSVSYYLHIGLAVISTTRL